ncbi:DM13 domain-containing protein [Nocardia sp. BMG51109]|uniref:DM13 domain-containing protein n=1 Tax=Nocardia sp. BMG51109 TaxID=1056816 RepID=UPI0004B5C5CD|nr:DM13 domain-containing protein [Nocardia sp. BMG51109]
MSSIRLSRPRLLAGFAICLVFALAIGLYLFQPWRLFTTVRVDEAAVVAADGQAPPVVAMGTFVSHEHSTSGSASLQRAPDGTATLRISDLRTSDGPALHVWLSDQPVRPDDWHNLDDGRYIDLGALKGNQGNQNYQVPAGTDPTGFDTVTIWCERFSVSFGAAALVQP